MLSRRHSFTASENLWDEVDSIAELLNISRSEALRMIVEAGLLVIRRAYDNS